MLIELSPRVIVVYGAMPKDVFADYLDYADFHRFNDWISDKKGNYVRRIIADQQYFDF